MLLVVVDTEEEFDWSAPFSSKARSTSNMREQRHAQAVLDRHGARPLYAIDHPVATDAWSAAWLRETRADGRCDVGSHLHTWVNPPHEGEGEGPAASYGCNLPPALERRKIEALTEAVAEAMGGQPPVHFRSGRYGIGPATPGILAGLGYTCDLSLAPHSSFAADGGPQFYGWSNAPFRFGPDEALVGLPVTTGFSGLLSGLGAGLAPSLDAGWARGLRAPGLLARLGLLERCRLTPEGVPLDSLQRLMAALVGAGERVLTLSYHSSTLLPGATPYARDAAQRDALLGRLDGALGYFVDALGGRLADAGSVEATVRAHGKPLVNRRLSEVAYGSCNAASRKTASGKASADDAITGTRRGAPDEI